MRLSETNVSQPQMPSWVPEGAKNYIAHTQTGCSIRALARESNCHPSTILRQVRRFEMRRDDPLIDNALRSLSYRITNESGPYCKETKQIGDDAKTTLDDTESLTQERIDQEAKRVLRRLCETGAVMAVAREMETAVIVRETEGGETLRTAVVDREIAQAMALKDWITCPDPSLRISRYFISNAGRSALRRLTAQDDNAASGFAEARPALNNNDAWDVGAITAAFGQSGQRFGAVESPLIGLARRKDRSGKPFLDRDLVGAGERMREDFEIASLAGRLPRNLHDFLNDPPSDSASVGSKLALERVQAALTVLGAGLADVAFKCCCQLVGLEQTEQDMGWSARSGKIVLRIALQRLRRHYDEQGKFAPKIG